MKAKLIVLGGGEIQDAEIELLLPVILGRSRRAGLLISQALVSRQHCEIYEQEGKLMIRDLGSMNGTRINQIKIDEPTELFSGDLLTVGAVTFRVDCGDNRVTLSDAKDETAVSLQSDLEQLLKVPSDDFQLADTPTDEASPEQCVAVPVAVIHDALATQMNADPNSTRDPDDRPDSTVRNPR